ncbi:MAG: LarC family nickel insertion protein, partial [Planctomycetota bacterium]|nr:LarC family nickel insertion protein [Planctomycetota bacterium]
YGAGQRDLELQPNLLRILVGSASEVVGLNVAAAATQDASHQPSSGEETIWVLETNLDDVTGEVVGYCLEQALQLGALDAFTTAIQMKKNRPGVMLSLLCRPAQIEVLEALLFRETTTLGVRRYPVSRRSLPRTAHSVETPWGTIEGKLISTPDNEGGGQTARFSPEYESCRRIAQQFQVPVREVMEVAQRAFRAAE